MKTFMAFESGIEGKWIVGISEDGKWLDPGYKTITGLTHDQCGNVISMLEIVYILGRQDKTSELNKVLTSI